MHERVPQDGPERPRQTRLDDGTGTGVRTIHMQHNAHICKMEGEDGKEFRIEILHLRLGPGYSERVEQKEGDRPRHPPSDPPKPHERGMRYPADPQDHPALNTDSESVGSWDEGFELDHSRLHIHVYAPAPGKVPRYNGCTQLSRENWFYQMQNYFEVYGIPIYQWTKFSISNCPSHHSEQIRHHRYLPSRDLKGNLRAISLKPDLTQYKIKQLCGTSSRRTMSRMLS